MNHPRFRFGLRTLLLVMLLVAVYLAGRRAGFERGYRKAEEHYGIESFRGTYPVADLVIPLPDGNK
jgi:hypothetical protein